MRSILGLVASGLAGLAAVIASWEGHGDIVPFFVLLTFAGGVAAWAAESPFVGARRRLARGIALAWLLAAVWVGVLLIAYVAASNAPAGLGQAYLGVPATVYHLVGLYAGSVLVLLLAFGRGGAAGSPPLVDV